MSNENVKLIPGTSSTISFTDDIVPSGQSIAPMKMEILDHFAKVEDTANKVMYSNLKASLDTPEQVTYTCDRLDKVSTTTPLAFPMPNRSGVQYTVKLEEIVRSTASGNPSLVYDEPIVMYLTVRHQTTGNVTPQMIWATFQRLIGAALKGSSATGWNPANDNRFGDLMRSALEVTKDFSI